MTTPKERQREKAEREQNSYFKRAILQSSEIGGRHAESENSSVVGAGANYPPASAGTINNSAVVASALNGPDPLGHSIEDHPPVGERFEQVKAAFKSGRKDEIAEVLARMTDRELQHEIGKAHYEMKVAPLDDTERLDAFQTRIDACQRELDRRRL
jgi:hypothetical protein